MRLLILSDLHLEVWRQYGPRIDLAVSQPDVVILAGDIHTGARAPAWAAETFRDVPVLYVAGNHEHYGTSIEESSAAIRKECERFENVHFLDNGVYVEDNVRFLGTTLWTDFALFAPQRMRDAIIAAKETMPDYKRINLAGDPSRKIQPLDTTYVHAAQRKWLTERLAEPFEGRTVVITHMAPSKRSVAPRFAANPAAAAFASNLEHLTAQADLWVRGHMHDSLDYNEGRCRIVANPLGYLMRTGSPENSKFNPKLVITL
jgi:predicted phosphodiesterase